LVGKAENWKEMASQGGELEGYSIILFVAFAPHLFAFLSQSNTKTLQDQDGDGDGDNRSESKAES
jgi:hypothetical protein